jgi:hypothetical protein
MTGDASDMLARLKSLLPLRWFPDATPVLDALLAGLSDGWAWLHSMLGYAKLQTRIATATDTFLDLVAQDCFGGALPRRLGEDDTTFRARIRRELLRDRATRAAMVAVLTDLTGRAPIIFEPARPADTGAWGIALGYGAAGGWGSLMLPFQSFVTAFRPLGSGVPLIAGWGSPAGGYGAGAAAYASIAMVQSQVSDAEINAAIARTTPVAATAWTRIAG